MTDPSDEPVPTPEELCEQMELIDHIAWAANRLLSSRDIAVLAGRLAGDTFAEIGDAHRLSRERTRQVVASAASTVARAVRLLDLQRVGAELRWDGDSGIHGKRLRDARSALRGWGWRD